MSNLSILERNIIQGLGRYDDPEDVEHVFLKARDRLGTFEAETKANDWGRVSDAIRPMLNAASKSHGVGDVGVMEFVRARLINMDVAR